MRSDPPDGMTLLFYLLCSVLIFQQGNRTNSFRIHFRIIRRPALTLHRHWLQVMKGKVDNLDGRARKAEEGVNLGSS